MAPSLKIELQIGATPEWKQLGIITRKDDPGSISDNHDGIRDIYVFGIDPLCDQAYLRIADEAVVVPKPPEVRPSKRLIRLIGFTTVAILNQGESHELTVRGKKNANPQKIRFTCVEEA